MQLADRVAEDLDLPRHHLALYVGSGRGAKAIGMPWVGDRAEAASALFPEGEARMRVALYCLGHHDPAFHRVARESLNLHLREARPRRGGEACF